MPTTKARHVVTETEEIADALDSAALRWPELSESRSKLLYRLVLEGHRAVVEDRVRTRLSWQQRLDQTSGVLTGVYSSDYLAELRQDWPE